MEIQTLFGDASVAKFIGEYLHRLPFALAGTAQAVCKFGTWDELASILGRAGEDAFAVRGGQFYDGSLPRDCGAAAALCNDDYTLFVRHAERHHPALAELAKAFEETFLGPVNIHVFATPAGAPGFSWHYDAEDVFIIQTAGEKEYSLRKNTVNPWPLEETLPADMQYERELMPLMRVLLRAGDLLYIPCGYWHKAEAKGERGGQSPFSSSQTREQTADWKIERKMGADPEVAISLAVGVMSRSAMAVYDFLRERLLKSLVWRQRLPVPNGEPVSRADLETAYRHVFEQLAADLKKTFADPKLVSDFLERF